MKFTENWKRFWSLNRHHAAGFTLVELIVVIAILAILAGVAVPAYSGYVTQANKQADISLANEVAHALSLHYYNNISGGVSSGYVILNQEGEVCGYNDFGYDAMVAAFGEGWENNVYLKYDGWNAKLFAAAARQNGIDAVGESPYIQANNATSLVGKVQGLINPAVELIGTKLEQDPNNVYVKMNMYLGEEFETFATNSKNGISVVNNGDGKVYAIEVSSGSGDFEANGKNYKYVSQEQLSNLMTLYVADGVGNTANAVETKIDYASLLELSIANGDKFNPDGSVSPEFSTGGLTTTEYLAVTYAMYSAIAEKNPSYSSALTDVDAGLADATNLGGVLSAMSRFWGDGHGLDESTIDYVMGDFVTDMDAIVATLGAAGDVADDYYDSIADLTDSTFFSSDEITGALSSFIGGASGMAGLTEADLAEIAVAGEGDIVVIIGKTGAVANSIGN